MPRAKYGIHTYGEIQIIGRGGKVRVGKFCSIAGDVKTITVGHRPDWITTYPFSDPGKADAWPEASGIPGHPHGYGPLVIGNDVWIGYGATLLGGITVEDGAVIGAGAVVTRDVRPYSIVAGNPAKTIRARFALHQIKALIEIKWWDWPEEKIRKELPLMCSSGIEKFIEKHKVTA